jgi:cell division protein FtsX
MIIRRPWLRRLVAVSAAGACSLSGVVVVGYEIPLLLLKLRFGFEDDDIPMGYGFDLMFISIGAFVIGLVAAAWLSVLAYRRLTPSSGIRLGGQVQRLRND